MAVELAVVEVRRTRLVDMRVKAAEAPGSLVVEVDASLLRVFVIVSLFASRRKKLYVSLVKQTSRLPSAKHCLQRSKARDLPEGRQEV